MFRDVLVGRWGVPEAEAAVLEGHYELLCRWNKVVNLTGIVSPEEAVERHYGEALFLAGRLGGQGLRIADVGSGAGFPGFPVAVVRPGDSVTLIEADQRKAVFLREASRKVENVRVVAVRAEAMSDRFDWVISRAVSYADLEKGGIGLGVGVALLTGGEAPPSNWKREWEVVPVPGSRQRFLRISRSEVPRETGA